MHLLSLAPARLSGSPKSSDTPVHACAWGRVTVVSPVSGEADWTDHIQEVTKIEWAYFYS